MKIGFELEAFCVNPMSNAPMLVPAGLPYDECGWLVEIRSEPHSDVTKATWLLRGESVRVTRLAEKEGVKLVYTPLMEIPRDLKVQAARRYGKGPITYLNVYGHETHRNSTKLQTASLHISFTNQQTYTSYVKNKEHGKFDYPGFVDHAKLIVGLDRAFKEEIAKAKRNPGFYERKGDGRIEYRSLPNNVDLNKVEEVLTKLLG